jgi:epoxyqueuosine reductase
MIQASSITAELKQLATEQGFVLAGATPAQTPPRLSQLHAWLSAGYAGTMNYFQERLAAYEDLNLVLPGAKSLLVLAMPYKTTEPVEPSVGQGRVARYAWGLDYHQVLWQRMDVLCDRLRELIPGVNCRGVTDSAPLLEREFAQLAGLGWIGKNTLLLNRQWGSWFFLAAIITDCELQYDQPFAADHCGTCTACLQICPTQAFPQPYVLDATKCISYLTIEQRDSLSETERTQLGDWLWGCDLCQEVCPWNNHVPETHDPAWQPRTTTTNLELTQLFSWSDAQFYEHFRRTALWRARRRGLLRNAAIVLANQQAKQALPALQIGATDADEIVREACAWAIKQMEL